MHLPYVKTMKAKQPRKAYKLIIADLFMSVNNSLDGVIGIIKTTSV